MTVVHYSPVYWKTFRRGGNSPEGHTVGFEWFATWPSSRRLRFPFGRKPRVSPLVGWFMSSAKIKRLAIEDVTKETKQNVDGNATLRDYQAVVLVRFIDACERKKATAKNPRQGWAPDGSSIFCLRARRPE